MKTMMLDITAEHCPMTFVKTKLELEKLDSGDKLEVLLTKGEPLDNVPKSAAEQGFKVREVKKVDEETYRVLIER